MIGLTGITSALKRSNDDPMLNQPNVNSSRIYVEIITACHAHAIIDWYKLPCITIWAVVAVNIAEKVVFEAREKETMEACNNLCCKCQKLLYRTVRIFWVTTLRCLIERRPNLVFLRHAIVPLDFSSAVWLQTIKTFMTCSAWNGFMLLKDDFVHQAMSLLIRCDVYLISERCCKALLWPL